MIVYSRQENSHHFKVDVHFNTQTKHGMLLPPFVISYFERHATSFHNQKQSSSQGNQANVIVFDSDSFVIECCTEATFGMEKHEIGMVRSHPNYQGNGPWRDWVMAKIPDETDGPIFNAVNPTAYHTIPCQVMCFVCLDKQMVSQTDTQQQSKGNTLVQHKQGLTHVLLRTTHPKLPPEECEMSKLDKERSSTLFKRWSKQYVKTGNQRETAKIVLVPVNWIVRQVGVIDENPELINEGDAVGQFLQSETEQSLLREDAKNQKYSDIIWEVKDVKKWADEFASGATYGMKNQNRASHIERRTDPKKRTRSSHRTDLLCGSKTGDKDTNSIRQSTTSETMETSKRQK